MKGKRVCVRGRESSKAGWGGGGADGGGEGEKEREGAHGETGEDKKDEWVAGSA